MIKFGFLANRIIYRDSFDLAQEKIKWCDLLKWCKLPMTAKLFIGCKCSDHGGMCPVTGIGLEDYSRCTALLCHPVGGRGESWNLGRLTAELSKTPKNSWNRMLNMDVVMARQVDTARQILIRKVDMRGKHIIFGSSDWVHQNR